MQLLMQHNFGTETSSKAILVNNQLDVLFSMYLFIYFTSLHVSSNPVLIIRRVELY